MGAGRPKEYKKTLYGDYPDLTDNQREYVQIISDPETKYQKLTHQNISDIIGISKESVDKYSQKPEIRKAITQEAMMKVADSLPVVMGRLLRIIKSPKTTVSERLKAIKLYGEYTGLISEAKNKEADTRKNVKKSSEKKLMEINERFNSRRQGLN